jgi:hypothetical protein
MGGRIKSRVAILAVAGLWAGCGWLALGQSNGPSTGKGATAAETTAGLPHDQHDGLTVSADPYIQGQRAKDMFGKANPLPAGILPVEIFLHNDTAEPIQIGLDTIQLDIHNSDGRMDGVDALGPVEAAFLIVHPAGAAEPKARRFPIGLPGTGKDKKVDKLAEILRPLSLQGDIVPPKGTLHGFLYFNMSHQLDLVNRASLYIPDAVVATTKQTLMFYEVPLGDGDAAGGKR